MWTKIDGKYLEFSNVLSYYWIDNKGNRHILNFANDLSNLQDALKYEVQKYAFSKDAFKPFKMVKRMWSLARSNKDFKIIKLLTPLMQTDLGRLSQISSEIETLVNMLENIRTPPMLSIIKQIDGYLLRIASIFELNINEKNTINEFHKLLKHKNDKEYLIKHLKELKKFFTGIINNETIHQLKEMGLYPPPANYLP
jgi:hypothetical protein